MAKGPSFAVSDVHTKKRAAFWVLEDELFVNMGDFQGRTVTRTLGEGYRGPNSHWLVDE